MGKVTATRWLDVKESLFKIYKQEGLDKVFLGLTLEDQLLFAREIEPVSWIDYGAYLRYIFLADKILGNGDHQLLTRSAEYACEKQFSGMYKFLISFVNPRFVLKRVAQVWRQFHSDGEFSFENIGEKEGQLVLIDFPDIPLHHELSHIPYMKKVMEMSSAQNVQINHPKCMARGDDHCLFKVTWE